MQIPVFINIDVIVDGYPFFSRKLDPFAIRTLDTVDFARVSAIPWHYSYRTVLGLYDDTSRASIDNLETQRINVPKWISCSICVKVNIAATSSERIL